MRDGKTDEKRAMMIGRGKNETQTERGNDTKNRYIKNKWEWERKSTRQGVEIINSTEISHNLDLTRDR